MSAVVALVLAALVWAYAVWLAVQCFRAATELRSLATKTLEDERRSPTWLREPLTELWSESPEIRARGFSDLVTEVDYRLARASSSSPAVRIAFITTLSITLFSWWNDRAVAWIAVGAGVCVTALCLALSKLTRSASERARSGLPRLVRHFERSVSEVNPRPASQRPSVDE